MPTLYVVRHGRVASSPIDPDDPELSALVNEHSNRTLFILTVVTVLALPINLVAGLLGMNVPGLPLQQHGQAFLEVVIALTAVTGLLAYLLFINRRD